MAAELPLDSPLIPDALREAVRHSPRNAPLLVHIADVVSKVGGFPEAELFFKAALALEPGHLGARVGLAAAFAQQGKTGPATVILETITSDPAAPTRALLLHARMLLKNGERPSACDLYRRARQAQPPAFDPLLDEEFAAELPTRTEPSRHPAASDLPSPLDAPGDTEAWKEEADPFGTPSMREAVPVEDWSPVSPADVERPAISFAEVGGMDSVKDEIRMKIILPLQQPDLFKAYGQKAGGGILLYGPPGCGKTYLARATAGEVKAGFIAVGINDVLEMWIGQSEKNLHALFEQARRHRPCVLFFDEVDALGANRTDMVRSGGRHLINQFLSELDGVASSNEGVLILAATNAPWHLDSAFRRPGRFDRILFVPPPDLDARVSILQLQLKGKPMEDVDFHSVAKRTEGYSGADLSAVVERAVQARLREAMKTARIRPIRTQDLVDAVKEHKPTTRDWFETARNYALYANQGGLYDDVLAHLKIKR